jgi:hypothetical protein
MRNPMNRLLLKAVLIPVLFSLLGLHERSKAKRPRTRQSGRSNKGDSEEADAVLDKGDVAPAKPKKPEKPIHPPPPNKDPRFNPTYTRDSDGRVTNMTVDLKAGEFTPLKTSTLDMAKWGFNGIPPGKIAGDDMNRGHILGAQLGGTNHQDLQDADNAVLDSGGTLPDDRWKDYENFTGLNEEVNRPLMSAIENEVAKGVNEKGREVTYTVELEYENGGNVPSHINIKAETIDGLEPPVTINERIPNVEDPQGAGYTPFNRSQINW